MADTWRIVGVMEAISKDALEKLNKVLDKEPGDWRGSANIPCRFGLFNREGAPNRNMSGHACHALINNYCNGEQIIINSHGSKFAKYPEFISWVCRESPFAHGVLNKDEEKRLLNNGMIIDSSLVGKGGALWLCKAARHCVEDVWTIPLWRRLQEYGLDPLQAFIGADILNLGGKPKVSHSHCSLFRYDTPHSIRAFYDEIRNSKKIDTRNVNRPNGWNYFQGKSWGELTSKKEKRSDGWGGFTEVDVPCDPKEYVDKLKEIFEGDPKNVK